MVGTKGSRFGEKKIKLTSSIRRITDRLDAGAVHIQVCRIGTGALDVLGVTAAGSEGGGGAVILAG